MTVGRRNAQLLSALELQGIDHAGAVVAGIGEQVQILGNGHAAAVVEAVVAAQAGADVVFSAFLGLLDDFGIGHGGAAHEHVVGLPLGKHFFSDFGAVDAAHHADGNGHAGLLHDFAGPGVVRHGIEAGRMHLGTGEGVDAVAAGDVDHVHVVLEDLDLFGGFFGHDAAFHAVGAVEAQFDEQAVTHHAADFLEDHHGEAAAVFNGAAEFVGAVVGERGEEVVDEPAVGEVQHEAVEVGYLGPVGVFAEQGGDFFHFRHRGGLGAEMGFVVGGDLLEARAHVGAAVDEFRKASAVVGVDGALEALEIHLVAGLGVQIEAVFVAAVDGHFHGQGHGGESAADEAHPEVDAEGVDAAVAVFAAARGAGADGGHAHPVVEHDLVLAHVHGFKKMRILFFVYRFHSELPRLWSARLSADAPCGRRKVAIITG